MRKSTENKRRLSFIARGGRWNSYSADNLKLMINIDSNGCWLWKGYVTKYGYGFVGYKGRVMHAHRLSYMLFVGPIPKGLFICHSCDVRACVNPRHLWVGTHTDNVRDMMKKKRSKGDVMTHCKNGHAWIDANIYRSPDNMRHCRICKLYAMRRFYGWSAEEIKNTKRIPNGYMRTPQGLRSVRRTVLGLE